MGALCKCCAYVLKCLSNNFRVYRYRCRHCGTIKVTAWYYGPHGAGTTVKVTARMRSCPKRIEIEEWHTCGRCHC